MSDPGSMPSANVGEESENVREEGRPPKSGRGNCFERVACWFAYKDKGEWLKDMKGSLSLAASIIATMTFQLATNPPGGIVQVSVKDDFSCSKSNVTRLPEAYICPGEAVLASVYPRGYLNFLTSNTICFIASLSVCLLLVSGIPLNHPIPIWLLSIGMSITITSLALTYMFAASMVTPDPIWDQQSSMFNKVLIVWIALLGIVGLFIITRSLVRCVYKIQKHYRAHNRMNENRATFPS